MTYIDKNKYDVLPNGQIQSKYFCQNCGHECHCPDSLIPMDPSIDCDTCDCEGTNEMYTYSNN